MSEEDLQTVNDCVDYLYDTLKKDEKTKEDNLMCFFALGEIKGIVIKCNPKLIGFKEGKNER